MARSVVGRALGMSLALALAHAAASCCFGPGTSPPAAPAQPIVQAPAATPLAPVAAIDPSDCYAPTGAAIVRDGTLRVHCRALDGSGTLRTYSLPDLRESAPRVPVALSVTWSAFSEDGEVVALDGSSGASHSLVVVRGGAEIWRRDVESPGRVLTVSPDGSLIAFSTTHSDEHSDEQPHEGLPLHDTLHVVRAGDGEEVARIETSGSVDSAIFTRDGRTLYAGEGWIGRVHHWSAEGGTAPPIELPEHRPGERNVGVIALALSPDERTLAIATNLGRYFAISAADGAVTSSGRNDWDPTQDFDLGAPDVAWSAATQRLYVAAGATVLATCDAATGRALAAHTYRATEREGLPEPRITTSPDGARLVVRMRGVYVLDAP